MSGNCKKKYLQRKKLLFQHEMIVKIFLQNWIEIFRNFPNIHVATLVVSIVSIAILVAGREINMRFK